MTKKTFEIVTDFTLHAPARLHLGMYCIDGVPRFGGLGVMIEEPAVVIDCRASDSFRLVGRHNQVVAEIVRKLKAKKFLPVDPEALPVQIELQSSPPRHCGLGSGTQIAIGVASTLIHCCGLERPNAGEMAQLVNRGGRSAVGSHGFFRGGCIAEAGIDDGVRISPIEKRIEFPTNWPIVLIRPQEKSGLHGPHEEKAFDRLRDTGAQKREHMTRLCHQRILPGIAARDYDQFATALYLFNRTSGEYFADFQSGAYNSPRCAEIVESVLRFGVPAVGQSSWGPTLFAVAPDEKLARELVTYLRSECNSASDESTCEIRVTSANNSGARIIHQTKKKIRQGKAITRYYHGSTRCQHRSRGDGASGTTSL